MTPLEAYARILWALILLALGGLLYGGYLSWQP